MKKLVFYFDHTATKMFVEKITESGEKKIAISSRQNFVYTSEIVARIIDIDNDDQIPTRLDPGYTYYNIVDYKTIKAESGIYYDQAINAYKSAAYGFVAFDGERIKWISPLSITRDKQRAYYTIHPTKFGKVPSYNDIQELLQVEHILASLPQKKIEEQLSKIDPNENRTVRIVAAQGKEPVHGHEDFFIPLVNIEKRAGEIKADGSIDYKETGSIIQIVKDQEILQRVPEVKPVDGYDIFGDKSLAETKVAVGYKKGENLIQSGKDENVFLSAIDGCLEINKNVISILPIAVINSDVNYESGNIDFNGSVLIKGSVLPGFSVKAKGDVIIEKSVEDAYVEADGDVTVKMGVVGKDNAKIVLTGKLTAKYLLNATVEAAGEITIEDSIINSNVFSNDKISVVSKHGKIIGGKTTALYNITVNVAGSPNETAETQLFVGRNLFIEKELDDVNKEISIWRQKITETIRELKVNFGESVFENPKEFIAILPPIKKKKCLLLLKELSDSNKELKILTEKSKEIQAKLKLDKEPTIIVKNRVYPGTSINIKRSVKKIEKPADNLKFYEDPNDRIIRFTSGV